MERRLTKSIVSLVVLVLSFGATSCTVDPISNNNSSVSTSSDVEIKYANVSLRYYYEESSQSTSYLGFAHLWYEGETLGGVFKDVIQPRVLVAGDVFHFSYKGELADQIMSIPGVLDIWGELIDYEYIKTTMEKVEPENGPLVDTLNNLYQIDEPYVILNQQGAYTSLEKFEGDKVYVTLDYKKMYINVDKNDSRQYEPSLPIAAAIYAYDPRNS